MTSTRSAWKRARTLLVVVCAALGIANLVQRHFETSPTGATDSGDIVESIGSSDATVEGQASDSPSPATQNVAAVSRSIEPEAGPKPDAATAGNAHKVKRQRSGGQKLPRPGTAALKKDAPPRHQTQAPRSIGEDPPLPDPRPPVSEVVRPLGIVELADGRIQAVIDVGGWVQFVEEGQFLADNSRVVKVTAEGVQLEWPPGKPGIEIAEAANPTPTSPPREIPQIEEDTAASPSEVVLRWNEKHAYAGSTLPVVTADAAPSASEVPGFESGQASYKETVPSSWNARRQLIEKAPNARRAEASGLQKRADFESSTASPGQDILGFVELADGQVQTVVADGPWVKLVPEGAVSSEGAKSPEARPGAPPVGGLPPEPPSGEGDNVTLPGEKAASLPLPNFVEPIGLVEWPGGRVQAILAQGDFIELAEAPALVAETRRVLALAPPGIPSDELAIQARDRPARAPEDQIAMLGSSEYGEKPRAPPDTKEAPPREPEEAARGQPERRMYAFGSRAPPGRQARADDFWQADLPGIEETASANITRPAPSEHLSSPVLAEVEDVQGMGVSSGWHENVRGSDLEPLDTIAAATSDQDLGMQAASVIEALGFVRWPDGRIEAVLAVGESTVLVEKGQTLEDGRRVLEVGPAGVALGPAGDQPANPGFNSGGHTEAPTSHLMPDKLVGSVLQLEPPVRNNRSQPRE